MESKFNTCYSCAFAEKYDEKEKKMLRYCIFFEAVEKYFYTCKYYMNENDEEAKKLAIEKKSINKKKKK